MAGSASSSARKWTPQQLEAITRTGCNLLVSAAAGSGKTSVLAERCVYLVCDAKPRCHVSQLLVVTFTDAAAAEMKGRIEIALRRRLRQNGDDAHLQRQLALLEHANISTLHSFCARLLRQHFHAAALDPDFRVFDGDESKLLRREVARKLLAERYEDETGQAFRNFLDDFTEGDDERLVDLLVRTHEMLQSLVDPDGWLRGAVGRIAEAAQQPLENSQLGRDYLAILGEQLNDLVRECQAAVDALSRMAGFDGYVAYARHLLGLAESWRETLAKRGYDGLADVIASVELPRLPSVRNTVPGKEAASAIISPVQKLFKEGDLIDSLKFTTAEWHEGLRSILPHVRLFADLLDAFAERYRLAKEAQHAIDFSDLERLALRLLAEQRGERLYPSPVARLLHRQFQHVLVDEYQDINAVQDAILFLASHEADDASTPNLFCVGDVKQAIYGFRLAEPSRFLGRYARFREDTTQGHVVDLQANFRSRKPLLDVINSVFERLMTRAAAELEYDASQRLHAMADFPPAAESHFRGAPIELHCLPAKLDLEESDEDDADEADLERSEREAHLIARRIQEMMGRRDRPRMQVAARDADGNLTSRPIEYRDMVILLRAQKFDADNYANILRDAGIPVHTSGGSGYFQAAEIRDMMALLRMLDNQHQDIPLAAFLRSPLARLSNAEDALAEIRLGSPPNVPFHEAVLRYAERSDDLATQLQRILAQL